MSLKLTDCGPPMVQPSTWLKNLLLKLKVGLPPSKKNLLFASLKAL